jgi:hypothetical protein
MACWLVVATGENEVLRHARVHGARPAHVRVLVRGGVHGGEGAGRGLRQLWHGAWRTALICACSWLMVRNTVSIVSFVSSCFPSL